MPHLVRMMGRVYHEQHVENAWDFLTSSSSTREVGFTVGAVDWRLGVLLLMTVVMVSVIVAIVVRRSQSRFQGTRAPLASISRSCSSSSSSTDADSSSA